MVERVRVYGCPAAALEPRVDLGRRVAPRTCPYGVLCTLVASDNGRRLETLLLRQTTRTGFVPRHLRSILSLFRAGPGR